MEESKIEQPVLKKMEVSGSMEHNFKEIGNWTLFFSILGFIGIGLMFIASIVVTAVFTFVDNENMPGFAGPLLGSIYFILSLLYVLPVIYLYKFSTNIKKAIDMKSEQYLEIALRNFKAHFKYVGVFTIIMMGLYILSVIVMILSGVMTAFW